MILQFQCLMSYMLGVGVIMTLIHLNLFYIPITYICRYSWYDYIFLHVPYKRTYVNICMYYTARLRESWVISFPSPLTFLFCTRDSEKCWIGIIEEKGNTSTPTKSLVFPLMQGNSLSPFIWLLTICIFTRRQEEGKGK